jgi:hypothetical protein
MRMVKILFFFFILFNNLIFPGWACDREGPHENTEIESREKKSDNHSNHYTGIKEENHEGNEVTGQAAAWLFLAANLAVIMSWLTKGTIRIFSLKSEIRTRLERFNRWQKKYFGKWHYYLNPLALGVAFLHFFLSACPSHVLPEWGLVGISLTATMGLLLKIKGTPKGLKKISYTLHTHPIVFTVLLSILLSGHLMMD